MLKNGEGGYVADEETLRRLEGEGQVVFRYLNGNPNGSCHDIAGICNERGNVVGLMPHPEHNVDPLTGPTADGRPFFSSVFELPRRQGLVPQRVTSGPHASGVRILHGGTPSAAECRTSRRSPSSRVRWILLLLALGVVFVGLRGMHALATSRRSRRSTPSRWSSSGSPVGPTLTADGPCAARLLIWPMRRPGGLDPAALCRGLRRRRLDDARRRSAGRGRRALPPGGRRTGRWPTGPRAGGGGRATGRRAAGHLGGFGARAASPPSGRVRRWPPPGRTGLSPATRRRRQFWRRDEDDLSRSPWSTRADFRTR